MNQTNKQTTHYIQNGHIRLKNIVKFEVHQNDNNNNSREINNILIRESEIIKDH